MNKYLIIFSLIIVTSVSFVSAQNFIFTSDLSLGSRGSDVVNLQTWLIQNGFKIPAITRGVTGKGYFGAQTKEALATFQRSKGIPAYGYFGPLSRKAVNGENNNKPPTGAGPLRITSPNGSENWVKGTNQNITWTSPAYFRATYADLNLVPTMPVCNSGMVCAQYMPAPYKIVSGLSINQNSYSWNVGNVLPTNMSNSSFMIAPDGKYTLQICETGTINCDSSDSSINILSSANYSPGFPVDCPAGYICTQNR